jgi:predicted transcriptional regulator
MSNFRLKDVPRVSCVDKNNSPLIKESQMGYLVCALICTGIAIQQNVEYFVRKWREFFNSVQIAVK